MNTAYIKHGIFLLGMVTSLAANPAVAAAVPIASEPLFLTLNVPPNVIVTLDDSGSMARAFTPDVCGNPNGICGLSGYTGSYADPYDELNHRFLKSSHYNPIYYNPAFVYKAPVDANGNALATSFADAHINGFATGLSLNSVTKYNLSSGYRPSAGLFLHTTIKSHEFMRHYASDVRCRSGSNRCQYKTADDNWVTSGTTNCGGSNSFCQTQPMPAYYYKFDDSNAGCTGTDEQKKTDNDCYDLVIVSSTSGPGTVDYNGDGLQNDGQDERQNFANWYSFYRTRNLATISATALGFASISSGIRLSWQALNSCRGSSTSVVTSDCEGWETTSPDFTNAINVFTGQHRQNFYNWLFRLRTNTSTPLREAMNRAGSYFTTSGDGSPYDDDFSAANSNEISCRRNYHILMTDGIYNDSFNLPGTTDNKDNTATTFPDAHAYTPFAPYLDTNSNSLADIAFYYWSTDLRGLTNNITAQYPDRSGTAESQYENAVNDPATWQHMVNYTVGLGLEPFLADVGLTWSVDTYGGSYPVIKSGSTPWPDTSSDGGKVADLWHAAVNSRGRFYSASDPSTLNAAFSSIVTAIAGETGASAALSANSTSILVGTLVYQAEFNSKDWSGSLQALPVSSEGIPGAPQWDASEKIPDHTARNIFTYSNNAGRTFDACNGANYVALKAALDLDELGVDDGNCAGRLAWLRGNSSQEVRKGGTFRNRLNTVMGDVINSDPAFVYSEDYGYSLMSGVEGTTYAAYLTSKSTRVPMVYVGANDGMLHAVRGDVAAADSGVEIFAFVPSGVYSNLSKLTAPSYSHLYYVDGAPLSGDAYWGGSWHTVLVGGLNAGGKTIYALDVSDPTNFSTSDVLWEYTEADMGLTYSQPQIARLNNGVWAAVFGNGYNSPSEQAYLYIVNLQTGVLIKKIPAGVAGSNGLSTPVLLDVNNDKITDYVYAGDLQGNMWKFDLSNNNEAVWDLAFSGDPLFTAHNAGGTAQSITARPAVSGHPNGGYMVFFGTGRYLHTNDVADMSAQSFYGIWDNGSSAIATTDRSELQSQTITFQGTELYDGPDDNPDLDLSFDVRTTSKNSVDWSSQRGWYMDLLEPSPASPKGERVVSMPIIRGDRVIFVTLIPHTDQCSPGGDSWLMELDTVTGGAPAGSVFDLTGDDVFDSSDLASNLSVVSGIKTNVGISKTPVWLNRDADVAFKELSGTSGGIATIKNKGLGGTGPSGSATRTYWMEIR